MRTFTHSIFLIIAFLLLPNVSSAQSWKKEFSNLILESREYTKENPEKAILKIEEAYELAVSSKNHWYACNAKSRMGYVAILNKDYSIAHLNFVKALDHLNNSDTTDYPSLVSIHQNLALIYRKYKSYNEAITHYEKALETVVDYQLSQPEIFDKMNHGKYMVDIPYNLALAQRDLGDYESSGEILLNIWHESENKKDTVVLAKVLIQLGLIQQRAKDYRQAEEYLGMVASTEGVAPSLRAIAWHNLGALSMERELYNQAQRQYGQALTIKKDHNSKRSQFITYLDMGEVAFKTKRIRQAIALWEDGLEVFDKVSGEPELFEIYNWLQLAYMELDINKARKYNQLYAQMNKDWGQRQQLQQTQNSLYALQNDINRIKESKIREANLWQMLRTYWAAILGIILTASVLVYLIFRVVSLRKKKAALAEAEQVMKNLR